MSISNTQKRVFQILLLCGSIGIIFLILIIPIDRGKLLSLGYVGVFLICFITAAGLIPGPSMIATFLAAGTLNPILISMAAGIGSAIGEATGYAVGYGSRLFLVVQEDSEPTWRSKLTSLLVKSKGYFWLFKIARSGIQKYPFLTVFLIAAIPNPVVDIAGIVAGSVKYPFYKFFAAMTVGKIVRFAMVTYLGVWFMR